MYVAIGSINKLKKGGGKGQPCRVTLVMVNGVERIPKIYTWADGVHSAIMAKKNRPVNLNLVRYSIKRLLCIQGKDQRRRVCVVS